MSYNSSNNTPIYNERITPRRMKKRRFSELVLSDETNSQTVKIRSYTSIPFDIAISHNSTRSSDGRIVLSNYEPCPSSHLLNIQEKHKRGDHSKPIPVIRPEDDEAVRKMFTRIYKCFTKPYGLAAEYSKRGIRITFQVNVIWKEDLEAFGKDEVGMIFPKDETLLVTLEMDKVSSPSSSSDATPPQ